MHHVYMSTGNDPFNREPIGATGKSRFAANGLEPGTFYWFAVPAIGAAGETSKSRPRHGRCVVNPRDEKPR